MYGMAVWSHTDIASALIGYEPVNDRIIVARIVCNAKQRNVRVIQVYGLASSTEEEASETFYAELERVVKRTTKGDILLMIGDFNAKVGAREPSFVTDVVGPYGLGEVNDAGERLEEFCAEQELTIYEYMVQAASQTTIYMDFS